MAGQGVPEVIWQGIVPGFARQGGSARGRGTGLGARGCVAGSRARGCIAGCRVPMGEWGVLVGCRDRVAGAQVMEVGRQGVGKPGVGGPE